MIGSFKHGHRRRHQRSRSWASLSIAKEHEPVGAGSGGGNPPLDGSQNIYFQGQWGVGAGQIKLVAEDHTESGISFQSSDPVASLLAIAHDGSKGRALVLGTQGVRIVSQTNPNPKADRTDICGVEIYAQDDKEIILQQGLYGTQKIVMDAQATTLNSSNEIIIQCVKQITLQVCGGLSSITLTPEGIVMKGLLIQIN
jgi:hypothetical protein